mgnify:CR=1 FL=1
MSSNYNIDNYNDIHININYLKNLNVDNMINEGLKYAPVKIIRCYDEGIDKMCSQCNKRSIYKVVKMNEFLCWFHGLKKSKNN